MTTSFPVCEQLKTITSKWRFSPYHYFHLICSGLYNCWYSLNYHKLNHIHVQYNRIQYYTGCLQNAQLSFFKQNVRLVLSKILFKENVRLVLSEPLFKETVRLVLSKILFKETVRLVLSELLFKETVRLVLSKILFKDTVRLV